MSPSAARRDPRADARRILAVETLTDGWGVVSREVAGGRKNVQAWTLRVTSERNDSQLHAVIRCPTSLAESEIQKMGDAIRAHFSAASAAFVVREPPGRAEAVAVGGSESPDTAFSLAAAVAVNRRTMSWYETDPLRVLLGSRLFLVSLEPGTSGWQASVHERSAAA